MEQKKEDRNAETERCSRRPVWTTHSIAMMGLLIALQIVASKVLSIKITDWLRLSIGDSFIILAGLWFGPAGGAIVGAVSDILGCVVSGMGIIPWLTLGPMMVGVMAGMAAPWLRHAKNIWRYGAVVLVIGVVVSVLYRSWALSFTYGVPFMTYAVPRSGQTAVLVVLNTIVVYKLYHSPVTRLVKQDRNV